MPQIVNTVTDLRQNLRHWRRGGETIAFVPTMGNLHEGHIQLVNMARKNATRIVVSIFVNPLQFPPGTDYSNYPRTLEKDLERLGNAGVELVFNPGVEEVYPDGEQGITKVHVPQLGDVLCGLHRPGHFDGVTTVCAKLFNWVRPDIALFGEKDFQQLLIIKKMVRDLGIPLSIISVPTVREEDGLAMSSRNQYLSEAERSVANHIYLQLHSVVEQVKERRAGAGSGAGDFSALEKHAIQELTNVGFEVDYLQVLNEVDLLPASFYSAPLRVFAAAWLGKARLIDNLAV